MIVSDISLYDGSQLQKRFAFHYFGKNVSPLGDIIAFLAPMQVEGEFMVDLEDLEQEDFIYSESAMQFLLEVPNLNLFAGVCFQRLFNQHLGELLASFLEEEVFLDGDDILVGKDKRKASVSIAKEGKGAVLIHTAINITAGNKAPSHAFSTNLSQKQAQDFLQKGCEIFYDLTQDIFVATAKIRSIL